VTRLILWRHGQTDWNAGDRIQGQADIDLSAVGRAQALESASRLAALKPDLLFSSDLRRAADTAAALAALVDLPVGYDERLRERYYGEWEGLTGPEIAQRWPAAYARWRVGEPVGVAGVEDVDPLAKRMVAALQEIASTAPPDATIVVATHGGVAKQGVRGLLDWPETITRTLGGLHNCHHTDLRFSSVRGWQLCGHNIP
jgi:glucosyl-3-phosphoglycerate phosphatase